MASDGESSVDAADFIEEDYLRFVAVECSLRHDPPQRPVSLSPLTDSHRNSNDCGVASSLRPGMVGDCEDNGYRRLRVQPSPYGPAGEFLGCGIRRYQPKAPQGGTSAGQNVGAPIPPIHDKISALLHSGM